jgi:sterol desaturase/sphingolipid hydroxylase (fatty acid hydroxylase superfamily)
MRGIILWYAILSVHKQVNWTDFYFKELSIIFVNLLITEILNEIVCRWFIFPTYLSIINLILLFLFQDVYFYTVHYIMHKYFYSYHQLHHEYFGAVYAWMGHPLEHVILNIGSFGIPFLLFPNPYYVYLLLICQQIYTSINGHTDDSPHHRHHRNPTKRYGSIYIVDTLMDTFL